ncbi:MAG: isochorismatase family protein [Candidatus Omnitrophica bacterium]|nr:isochorismatase family protein [Candidatus Omnitrophota bacterium]
MIESISKTWRALTFVAFMTVLALLSAAPSPRAEFAEPPLKICLVSGSAEYESDVSLPQFKDYLETRFNVQCVLLQAIGFEQIPGLEALDDCDAALFFTRRLRIEGEPLERIKQYCLSGKPVVAVRTASHGFQNWLDMDKLVLGGNYNNHFGNGPTQKVSVVEDARHHPVLHDIGEIRSRYSLYKTGPIAADATLLMTASTPDHPESQPSAWVREFNGGRVFYTALGGVQDFENAAFRRLLANALFWTARRDVQMRSLETPPKRIRPRGTLHLKLRSRVQPFKSRDDWDEIWIERDIPAARTAVIICDMWDKHWCDGATERCAAIAPEMNRVVCALRDAGVQILHAPSETLFFYDDWPQRRRVKNAPQSPLPDPLDLPAHPLPIDDSDGGCDTAQKPWYAAWTRQTPLIDIGEYDGISDNGREIYNFLQQESIDTIFIMGVHTNMCILGRSFAIRQMTRWGKQCILVRDLTDAMYDPNDPPYVPHEEGTELVIRHIEKYWCPTISSDDLIAGLPDLR